MLEGVPVRVPFRMWAQGVFGFVSGLLEGIYQGIKGFRPFRALRVGVNLEKFTDSAGSCYRL